MTPLEITGLLATRNLGVGTWKDKAGAMHISITRMGKYNKNIAVPVELIPTLIEALQNKMKEVA